MPKNTGRGGKNYRRGNNKTAIKRELVLKEEGTVYGQILKMLGNGRVEVYCVDSVKRIGNIRGKMKRRVWIGVGDVVLISLRDFQNEKCDVILKYTPEEVRQLKAQDQIPDSIEVNENDPNLDIEFEEGKANDDSSDDDDDDSSDSSDEEPTKQKLNEEDIDNI